MWQDFIKVALRILVLLTLISAWNPSSIAHAIENPETELSKVGVTAQLGTKLDLSLPFTDEAGQSVTLRQLIPNNRPAIIVPAYYGCPRLCGMVLAGVAELINRSDLSLGKDFTVITASFDPDDTVEGAATRGRDLRATLTKPGIEPNAWRFLVGKQSSIDGLMQRLGFHYQRDGMEYAHTAAIFLVTPNGELSQFLAGITFDPSTARHALVEASQGTIGSALDQVFLFCFRYDHLQGKYVWAAFGLMRLGGLLTLSFLSLLIYRLWYRERRSNDAASV